MNGKTTQIYSSDADDRNQYHQSIRVPYSPNNHQNHTIAPSAPPVPFAPVSYGALLPQPQPQPQLYYHYQPTPTPALPQQNAHYYAIRNSQDRNDRHFPVNASLFVLGCVFPPLWFVGIFWKSKNVYEICWRKCNIIMSLITVVVFILYVFVMYLIKLDEEHHWPMPGPGQEDSMPPLPPI